MESTEEDVDLQMQEFIRVPGQVEYLFFFGWIICFDCYLTMLTILPLRFVKSCLLLVWTAIQQISITTTNHKTRTTSTTTGLPPPQANNNDNNNNHWTFHRRHGYQLIQVLIIAIIYRYLLCNIAIGTLYHWIRGQAMIKLYVIAAMIEIFDRLLSSLGQDCLDSLYWNTVHNPKSQRFVVAILVVFVYAALHTVLLLVHITTLNVALNNTSDHTVLTLLISGNFAEVKSNVFKKYNKSALFKIAAADICERFKLILFLLLVWLVHLCQDGKRAPIFLYGAIGGYVIISEILADWIKHAFICKFNFLPSSQVYREYGLIIAGDYTGIGHEKYNLDPTHAVVKRIGFAQIPLIGVLLKMITEMIKYGGRPSLWNMTILWLVLVAVKIVLGILLQRWALIWLHSAVSPEYNNNNVVPPLQQPSSSTNHHPSAKKNQ
jgi:Eukaryotic membrane protein family